ncbi:MAG: hypothetical protein JSU86_10920 [Phycisphaerales bacterium]|nr:MAG: hypothetical protein JSU86_10920 [Phycisphaerales bacterium]
MKPQSHRIARWLVSLVVVIAVGVTFYAHRREDASRRIKAEMLGIIEDMSLPSKWQEEAAWLVEAAHKEAFDNALDVTKKLGRKFDERVYYNKVFDLIIDRAREDGRTQLAESLANERSSFLLHVTER